MSSSDNLIKTIKLLNAPYERVNKPKLWMSALERNVVYPIIKVERVQNSITVLIELEQNRVFLPRMYEEILTDDMIQILNSSINKLGLIYKCSTLTGELIRFVYL